MRRGWLWALAGLLGGLVALAPLRWALERADAGRALAARTVSGSIWSGRLSDAQAGHAPLGDLSARLSPMSLLSGTAETWLSGPAGSGGLAVRRNGGGVRALTARLDAVLAVTGAPVAQAQSAGLTALFRDGRCERASGRLSVTLGPPIPSAAGLTGEARCDRDAVLLPLAAPSGEGLTLRVRADRSFTAELRLPATDPAALAAMGFAPAPGGAALRVEGRL
jgi:general secretion pathway protein N